MHALAQKLTGKVCVHIPAQIRSEVRQYFLIASLLSVFLFGGFALAIRRPTSSLKDGQGLLLSAPFLIAMVAFPFIQAWQRRRKRWQEMGRAHFHPEEVLLDHFSWGKSCIKDAQRVLDQLRRDKEVRDDASRYRVAVVTGKFESLVKRYTENDNAFRESVTHWQQSGVTERDRLLPEILERVARLRETQETLKSLHRKITCVKTELASTVDEEMAHILLVFELLP